MGRARQEEITDAVAEYLQATWSVLGTHHPGASGGIRLAPDRVDDTACVGAVIPDVLATRGAAVLLVESATVYSSADVQKLGQVIESGLYVSAALKAAGLSASAVPRLIPAIAFCPQGGEPSPPGFVVFHYRRGRVTVAGGHDLLGESLPP